MKPNIADTLDKQKLLDVLDEEIIVYEPADSRFDEGVLYLAKKLKATIALHVFDAKNPGEVERQAEEIEKRDAEIDRLRKALIRERDDAMAWDGIGTVSRINKVLESGEALRRDTQDV